MNAHVHHQPDGTTTQDIAGDAQRRKAVRDSVKRFLLARGETGATTAELTQRFGGHAVVRLNEIRHGDPRWDYRKQRDGDGYRYWLYVPGRHTRQSVIAAEQDTQEPPQAGRLF